MESEVVGGVNVHCIAAGVEGLRCECDLLADTWGEKREAAAGYAASHVSREVGGVELDGLRVTNSLIY